MEKKLFTLREQKNRDCMIVYANALQIDPENPIDVIFKDHTKKRTDAQNRLMWKWLGIMANFLRDEHGVKTNSEDMKDHFQREYLGFRSYETPDGEIKERPIGTSELTTKPFTEFLNRIDVYAGAELGLKLPHPADLYYEAMAMGARR